jgi:hypothetical membrane protein
VSVTRVERLAPLAGMAGAAAIGAGSLVAEIAYRGAQGEAYSPLSHYLSELGEVGVSSLALVFNVGLIAGGLCFSTFILGLARTRGGAAGLAFGATGVVAGLAGALVGLFPVNDIDRHTLSTYAFFNLGWATLAIASADFVLRPDRRFPESLAVLGGVSVATFLAFIATYVASAAGSGQGLQGPIARPAFSLATTLEWAAIASILVWTFATGVAWRAATRQAAFG